MTGWFIFMWEKQIKKNDFEHKINKSIGIRGFFTFFNAKLVLFEYFLGLNFKEKVFEPLNFILPTKMAFYLNFYTKFSAGLSSFWTKIGLIIYVSKTTKYKKAWIQS